MPSSNPKVHQQQFSTTESCFFFIEHWQLLQATKFGLKFTLVSFQFSTLALHTPPPQSAWEGGAQRSLHRHHHYCHHPGLHNSFHPTIQDGSTWSMFGAHGEHGDVFLFSKLGVL